MNDEFLDSMDNYHELIADNSKKMHEDELICECYCVSLKDIETCLIQHGDFSLELLTQQLKMGKSCGSCLKSANSWKKHLKNITNKNL